MLGYKPCPTAFTTFATADAYVASVGPVVCHLVLPVCTTSPGSCGSAACPPVLHQLPQKRRGNQTAAASQCTVTVSCKYLMQLLREGTTWNACFCPTSAAAQAAIAAPNGSLARAFAKLTAPMADIQVSTLLSSATVAWPAQHRSRFVFCFGRWISCACMSVSDKIQRKHVQASVAAAASCVFAAGGVSAHQCSTLPGPNGGMLELVEGHLHQNASNLLAHVVQSASAKDALASLPPHVRHPRCNCSLPVPLTVNRAQLKQANACLGVKTAVSVLKGGGAWLPIKSVCEAGHACANSCCRCALAHWSAGATAQGLGSVHASRTDILSAVSRVPLKRQ